MDAWVYVIQSNSTGRYYCGQSTDVERRVRQHNDPNYSLSETTKRFEGPWKLLWSQLCENRGEAMKLEKRIKKEGHSPILGSGSIGRVPPKAGFDPLLKHEKLMSLISRLTREF